MIGLVRRLFGLAVLLMVAYAGFRWGPLVFPRVERALGLGGEDAAAAQASGDDPTPEVAEAALDRFEGFRRDPGAERLALGSTELSSLVRYALPGLVPEGVSDVTVTLRDGRVRVGARVALDAFPRLPQLREVVGILPDTVALDLEGVLVPLDQSFAAFLVERVEASRIPIPRRMVGEILGALARPGPPSLPADALAVPIPDGVRSVHVLGDSLILEPRR